MSNRDDLLKVLSGQKPDRIPYIADPFWNEKGIHKFVPENCYDENTFCLPSDDPARDGYSSEPRTQASRETAVRMAQYLDMATIGVGKGGVFTFGHGGPGEIQPVVIERTNDYKILQYEGGHKRKVNFNPLSISYFDFPVTEENGLKKLILPAMKNPDRFIDVEMDSEFFIESGFVPTGSIQGFFSGVHNSFMSFEDTAINLLLNPEFMKRLIKRLAQMSLDAVGMYLDRGVEIIDVCDDLGTSDGLLLSPETFREFFSPWYEELVRIVHQKGGYVHLHSHGNIARILPDLVSTGIDILNPLDWNENPNLPDIVKKYSKDIIICGGSVGDFYKRSLEEKEFIVKRACALGKIAEKGYIFGGATVMESNSQEEWNVLQAIIAKVRKEEL